MIDNQTYYSIAIRANVNGPLPDVNTIINYLQPLDIKVEIINIACYPNVAWA